MFYDQPKYCSWGLPSFVHGNRLNKVDLKSSQFWPGILILPIETGSMQHLPCKLLPPISFPTHGFWLTLENTCQLCKPIHVELSVVLSASAFSAKSLSLLSLLIVWMPYPPSRANVWVLTLEKRSIGLSFGNSWGQMGSFIPPRLMFFR